MNICLLSLTKIHKNPSSTTPIANFFQNPPKNPSKKGRNGDGSICALKKKTELVDSIQKGTDRTVPIAPPTQVQTYWGEASMRARADPEGRQAEWNGALLRSKIKKGLCFSVGRGFDSLQPTKKDHQRRSFVELEGVEPSSKQRNHMLSTGLASIELSGNDLAEATGP